MAAEPTAAVNVDNKWAGSRGTPRVREVQIESERSKPCDRGVHQIRQADHPRREGNAPLRIRVLGDYAGADIGRRG